MKNYLHTAFILLITLLSACTKSGSSTITGKWQVISDNKSLVGGPLVSSETYIGKDGDYFNFTNNILYIKEGGDYDTAQYNLLSNDKIILIGKSFSAFDATQPSIITISNNEATIVVYPAGVITPAGGLKRTIVLKR
jgi:hypothetical protein